MNISEMENFKSLILKDEEISQDIFFDLSCLYQLILKLWQGPVYTEFKNDIAAMPLIIAQFSEIPDNLIIHSSFVELFVSFLKIEDKQIQKDSLIVLDQIIYLSDAALMILMNHSLNPDTNFIGNLFSLLSRFKENELYIIILGILLAIVKKEKSLQIRQPIPIVPSLIGLFAENGMKNREVIENYLLILKIFSKENQSETLIPFLDDILRTSFKFITNPKLCSISFSILCNLTTKGFFQQILDCSILEYCTKLLKDLRFHESIRKIAKFFTCLIEIDANFIEIIPLQEFHQVLMHQKVNFKQKLNILILFEKIALMGGLCYILQGIGSSILFCLLDESEFCLREKIYHLLWAGLFSLNTPDEQISVMNSNIFVSMTHFTDFQDDDIPKIFPFLKHILDSSYESKLSDQVRETIKEFALDWIQSDNEIMADAATEFLDTYNDTI
ncbi:hypothetical protein TRFO_00850 [Tritrichomonas foetus]|uniref:Uncharacterized protein n=1 Tax=Tritrichomonas foetus TaxID=1144522 RepID=A0A1J4L2F2_9EUKA|nr:hypothetical protein TRFO_00850 [Tritrichomonas foetus]|eukprot:OHT17594.1 hypothetical protein TRFO_00850 [Tritrichomonas foetus]